MRFTPTRNRARTLDHQIRKIKIKI